MGSTDATVPCALSKDILLVNAPVPANTAWIAHQKSRYPGLQIRWAPHSTDNPPEPLTAELCKDVTIICSYIPPADELMESMRFVQLSSAGADRWVGKAKYKDPNVIFCTSSGTHPPQIAEWVIGTYLMMEHRFLDYAKFQANADWAKPPRFSVEDSPGKRMGILGYGAIGRQCARIANAMGMEVYAYTRSARDTPASRHDDSYCVPGTGDPGGLFPAKWFSGPINDFLAQDLDVLVISLPLTAATRNLIGKEQFDILARRKTFLSNIARGPIVNTDALIDALEGGAIRGAALDVTDPEPLPADHKLWKAPNLFITPHVSWQTPKYWDRVLAILETNLGRLNSGEPLINVMNREHHY